MGDFPIPLKYIDVPRPTKISLDGLQATIDDYGNMDGVVSLSEP